MENVRIPKQGPTYFPYDRVTKLGDDPLYPLTPSNTRLPNSEGFRKNLMTPSEASYGSMDNTWNKKLPPNATGVEPEEDDEKKKQYKKVSRCMGILIMILSAITFLVGIINTVLSSVEFAQQGWKCLASDNNPYSDYFGPKSAAMRLLTWVWISSGFWTSIPPFIAGLALFRSEMSSRASDNASYNPGLPVELINSQKSNTNAPDIYRVFAVLSMIFSLPIGFLLGVIDIILSSYCQTSGESIIKFLLPIVVVVLTIANFVVVLVSWYKAKDASDSEYQYIGSTYTVYETYEPVLTAPKAFVEQPVPVQVTQPTNQCCNNGEKNPIVIVNSPPPAPAQPPIIIPAPMPQQRVQPQPRLQPQRMPLMQRPVLRRPRQPVRPQYDPRPQRQFQLPQQNKNLLNRFSTYSGMFLPRNNQPNPTNTPNNAVPPPNQLQNRFFGAPSFNPFRMF